MALWGLDLLCVRVCGGVVSPLDVFKKSLCLFKLSFDLHFGTMDIFYAARPFQVWSEIAVVSFCFSLGHNRNSSYLILFIILVLL